jgi:hypothetical protein
MEERAYRKVSSCCLGDFISHGNQSRDVELIEPLGQRSHARFPEIANMPELPFDDEFHISHGRSPFWLKDRMEPRSVMSPYAKSFGFELVEVGA